MSALINSGHQANGQEWTLGRPKKGDFGGKLTHGKANSFQESPTKSQGFLYAAFRLGLYGLRALQRA
jgi:hypothetical protein